jgi:hypothetical protein
LLAHSVAIHWQAAYPAIHLFQTYSSTTTSGSFGNSGRGRLEQGGVGLSDPLD